MTVSQRPAAFARCRRGVAAIEFAVVGALMAGAIVVMADLGLATQERMALDQALSAGVARAMDGADDAAIRAAVEVSAMASFAAGAVSVTVERSCACPENLDAVRGCASVCDGGALTLTFVDLAASRVFPGLLTGPITLDSALRVQTR